MLYLKIKEFQLRRFKLGHYKRVGRKGTFSDDEDVVRKCWRCGHQIPTGSICLICSSVNKVECVYTRKENTDKTEDC